MIDLNLFGTTIRAGYVVSIVSWENDADHFRTINLFGLDKDTATYYQEFALKFKSSGGRYAEYDAMGGSDISYSMVMSHLHDFYKLYPKVILNEIRGTFDEDIPIHLNKSDFDEWVEANIGLIEYNIIGYVNGFVDEPVEYEDNYSRVCDSATVYYLANDITIPLLSEVTSERDITRSILNGA